MARRDLEKMRDLLIMIEGEPTSIVRLKRFLEERNDLERHNLQLLVDAGYIRVISSNMLEAWVGPTAPVLRTSSAAGLSIELTLAGHEYLEATRDTGIWQKTQEVVAETGGSATLEIVKALATGFLKKKLEQHTGLEL